MTRLLKEQGSDEQDEEELGVAKDLRGVGRDEAAHGGTQGNLHERQRDAGQYLGKCA